MCKVNLITDLDKTLIYSSQSKTKECVCIEYSYNQNPLTYMTKESYELLQRIMKDTKFQIIPCTARSYEQTIRIMPFQKKQPRYMICDNGASVYVNGILDTDYDNFVKSIVREDDMEIIYNALIRYRIINANEILKIRSNRNRLIVIVFSDKYALNHHFDKVYELLKKVSNHSSMYKFSKSNRKLYIIPKYIDKSVAVEYLIKKYKINGQIVTAGDSEMDRNFVYSFGNIKYIPKHADFSGTKVNREKDIIFYSEYMLKNITQLLDT